MIKTEEFIRVSQECLNYIVVQKELPLKGKGYIIFRQCPQEQLVPLTQKLTEQLIEHNATKIYLSSSDANAPIDGDLFQAGNYRFRFDGTMDRLEKTLEEKINRTPVPGLQTEALSRENAPVFLSIYNRCFFHVPNSSTYGNSDIDRLLDPSRFNSKIIHYRNIPIGVIETSYEESIPEIASIAVLKPFMSKGLGRAALSNELDNMHATGYKKAFLKVSSHNTGAYALYSSMGFVLAGKSAGWYVFNVS